jgi:hypothetical protein
MGVGNSKQPIVSQLSNHVYCKWRTIGRSGVAVGSVIGTN